MKRNISLRILWSSIAPRKRRVKLLLVADASPLFFFLGTVNVIWSALNWGRWQRRADLSVGWCMTSTFGELTVDTRVKSVGAPVAVCSPRSTYIGPEQVRFGHFSDCIHLGYGSGITKFLFHVWCHLCVHQEVERHKSKVGHLWSTVLRLTYTQRKKNHDFSSSGHACRFHVYDYKSTNSFFSLIWWAGTQMCLDFPFLV